MAYKYCFWFVNYKTRRLGDSSRTYACRKRVTVPISTRTVVLLPMFLSSTVRESYCSKTSFISTYKQTQKCLFNLLDGSQYSAGKNDLIAFRTLHRIFLTVNITDLLSNIVLGLSLMWVVSGKHNFQRILRRYVRIKIIWNDNRHFILGDSQERIYLYGLRKKGFKADAISVSENFS